jgi:ankyrin repeat protein
MAALSWACNNGHLDIVNALIDPSVNIKNRKNRDNVSDCQMFHRVVILFLLLI